MNKKTATRISSIKKQARMITYNERGTSTEIETLLRGGIDQATIAHGLGVSVEYVTAVKQAMERRK